MKESRNVKIPHIQSIIFRGIFFMNTLLFVMVFSIIGLAIYYNVINVVGELRSDLLKQISINGSTINKAASHVGRKIYDDLSYELLTKVDESPEVIDELVEDGFIIDEKAFEALDIDLSLIIIMRNGYAYTSKTVADTEVESIKNSFWYINNFSNEKNNMWVTRFGQFNNRINMEISYVLILRDASREYRGIIIVSAKERLVYDVYQDIQRDDNLIYIIDSTGTIISHSNKNLIGVSKYYMGAFFEEYPKNSYILKEIADEKVLYINHHDPDTGWTIIEEYPLKNIWDDYENVFVIGLIAFAVLVVISTFISLYISRRISMPIKEFTSELEMSNEIVPIKLQLQREYYEIYTMMIIHNKMVQRLRGLFERVKEEEAQKRKFELDFLQAQINPHLLHNTLFSIRCLLELGKVDKATIMVDSFMKLLKAPINIDKAYCTLSDELQYLQDYINLMENRYESSIKINISFQSKLETMMIPRMMLQPIVENAIFHGFGEDFTGGIIDITAVKIENGLMITVQDNGSGLTSKQLQSIWSDSSNVSGKFNRIGLKNIKERAKIIYGESSDIIIESDLGVGTRVHLILVEGEDKDD